MQVRDDLKTLYSCLKENNVDLIYNILNGIYGDIYKMG